MRNRKDTPRRAHTSQVLLTAQTHKREKNIISVKRKRSMRQTRDRWNNSLVTKSHREVVPALVPFAGEEACHSEGSLAHLALGSCSRGLAEGDGNLGEVAHRDLLGREAGSRVQRVAFHLVLPSSDLPSDPSPLEAVRLYQPEACHRDPAHPAHLDQA